MPVIGGPIPKIKPAVKPLQNPWNLNIPGLPSNDSHGSIIGQPSLAPAAAPVAPVAPPPPPPPDFNALTLVDPQYTQGKQQLEGQNQITLEGLLNAFGRNRQSSQDQANAHGALFSGAAVNAQRSIAQDYANQQRQQALNLSGGQSNLYFDVFNRLKQQLGGV